MVGSLTGVAAISMAMQQHRRSQKDRHAAKAKASAETAAALQYLGKGMQSVEKEMGDLKEDVRKLTKQVTKLNLSQELVLKAMAAYQAGGAAAREASADVVWT